jgi:uncharacterized iron-regulated membrane protein
MTLRKVLFWAHLTAGVICGSVVFIMSFTGAAIALQPQILAWAERDLRVVEPPAGGGQWLGPAAIIDSVRRQRPDATVTGVSREYGVDQAAAVTVAASAAVAGGPPAQQTTVYVNPYTGSIVGQVDATAPLRRFFRSATDWHRWLALNGESRTTGRWITGVSNAAFLFLGLSGIVLWVPRIWSATAFRAVAFFRGGLTGKARDFNWHNVIGIWCVAILVVLTFTAMGMSFPKTYDYIYAVTGIQRPPQPQGQQGPPREGQAREGQPREAISVSSIDAAWQQAETTFPSWRSIVMRLPQRDGQPITFTMNDRERLNPMARSTLTVDSKTGSVVRWEPYESLMTGQRLRTWMRFGHTGELWGLPGQIVAGLACVGGCVLVITGFSLAIRRFASWRARRQRRVVQIPSRERPAA